MKPNLFKRVGGGFLHVATGLKLILKNRNLAILAVIPFLIDALLLFFGFYFGWEKVSVWSDEVVLKVVSPEDFWYAFLYYPLWAIFALGFIVLLLYGVFLAASVVAAPFNGMLAEATLKQVGVLDREPFSLKRWAKISVKMFITSLVKALIFAVVGVILFIFSFFPGLNLVAAFVACLIISFDNMDYSLEILEFGLKERFQFYITNITEFSGAASFLALTVMLPGLTLLLLPAAVVGSASLAGEIRRRG